MRFKGFLFVTLAALLALVPATASAQGPVYPGATPVQGAPSLYALTPISATAAINTQTTLTIPAPAAGLYNYVCFLSFRSVQDGTSTANVLAVTTSTNFFSFALKYSLAATADAVYAEDIPMGIAPANGCAKSAAAGTATTFVSPAGAANTTYTWKATYFQAP